jgi:hypothetical protein
MVRLVPRSYLIQCPSPFADQRVDRLLSTVLPGTLPSFVLAVTEPEPGVTSTSPPGGVVGVGVAVGPGDVGVGVGVALGGFVGVGVGVGVGLVPPSHVPLFVHQLSASGAKPGQLAAREQAAQSVYFEPLYLTDAPRP